jgi:hypothetical protein
MSEIKRHFVEGKMNLDLDERLIPEGQYRDAENIMVSTSEGSDVGAVENSLGNEMKASLYKTNAKCIGSLSDDSNQKIYYCVTSDESDIVAEYDDAQERLNILLESSRVNGSTLLNFSKNHLITGIVKIISGIPKDDLLAWTDDNEQPRCINIERAKTYGIDGFTEDDISLIKRPPLFAPTTEFTFAEDNGESYIENKFLSFATAYRYLDGEVSPLSPFTTAAFAPTGFKLDNQTFENIGMTNAFSAINIGFNTGEKQVTDILLVFKESNSDIVYVVDTFNKANNNWVNNNIAEFRFSNNKIYRLLNEDELGRTFDSVPRKAKALAVIGNRLAFGNYLEGYDMIDSYGEKVKMDFNLSLFTKNLEGRELPITYRSFALTEDAATIDLTGVDLTKNTRITFTIDLREVTPTTAGTFFRRFDFILNEDFIDCIRLSLDPEFVYFVENILTNGFLSDYTATPPDNSTILSTTKFLIDSATATSLTIKTPSITYQVDDTPTDPNDVVFSNVVNNWGFGIATTAFFKDTAIDSSCKTNRSYEAVMIYLDEYGRSTTGLSSMQNTLYIPQRNSVFQNKIRININHKPPAWAKYFRFAIKQDKKEYQIIYATIFYEQGLFRWVKLDGANKDKVKEGDSLIVKSDLSGVIGEVIKVRVLEVAQKSFDFIPNNADANNTSIEELQGLYMKIKPSDFVMDTDSGTFRSYERYATSNSFRPRAILGLNSASIQDRSLSGYLNTDTNQYVDYEINAGSRISIFFRNYESDGYNKVFDKSYVVQESYANFELWWLAEVRDLGDVSSFFVYEFFRDADTNALSLFVQGEEPGTRFERSKLKLRIDIAFSEGIVVFETEGDDALNDVYNELSQTFEIKNGEFHIGNVQSQNTSNAGIVELDFFNCYAFGNGVESYQYKDTLNKRYLNTDTRPTLKSVSEFREIRRFADITYSEPYIESLGINGLNNFNASKSNYKDDVVKKYGSIQKMIGRDSDLLLWQEDKTSRILFGKELVVTPNGESTLASTDKVLGTQVMYAGEHGCSRNPESVGQDGTRVYWLDEKRGDACRLSLDGITKISRYGLNSWFRNRFSETMNRAKVGCYDPYSEKYTISTEGDLIYIPKIVFKCSEFVKQEMFLGTFVAEIDYGIALGQAGFDYTTNGKPVNITIVYNGVSYSTGWMGDVQYNQALIDANGQPITTFAPEPMRFNKSLISPRAATITVEAPLADTTFQINGVCVDAPIINVFSIVNSHAIDAGKTINNRYKWLLGGYSSSYKHFPTTFIDGGGVSIFNKETGRLGTGYIPADTSTVILESFKGVNDNGAFGSDDTLSYLISDTEYTVDDIEVIKSLSTYVDPTTVVTGGSEVINRITFPFNRTPLQNNLYLIWDYSSLAITQNTQIFIYFDSSGSMNTTLAPLQTMRDTMLKDAMLPLYNNDVALYDSMVQIIADPSERTLDALNLQNNPAPVGNVISLVFQDEANSIYLKAGTWSPLDERTTQYESDIEILRNRLNSFAPNYYRGVVFQVATSETGDHLNFKSLVNAIQNGTGNYAGNFGLSDRTEFNYKYDIVPAATPLYYKDQIVNALREFGYNL